MFPYTRLAMAMSKTHGLGWLNFDVEFLLLEILPKRKIISGREALGINKDSYLESQFHDHRLARGEPFPHSQRIAGPNYEEM